MYAFLKLTTSLADDNSLYKTDRVKQLSLSLKGGPAREGGGGGATGRRELPIIWGGYTRQKVPMEPLRVTDLAMAEVDFRL